MLNLEKLIIKEEKLIREDHCGCVDFFLLIIINVITLKL